MIIRKALLVRIYKLTCQCENTISSVFTLLQSNRPTMLGWGAKKKLGRGTIAPLPHAGYGPAAQCEWRLAKRVRRSLPDPDRRIAWKPIICIYANLIANTVRCSSAIRASKFGDFKAPLSQIWRARRLTIECRTDKLSLLENGYLLMGMCYWHLLRIKARDF